MRSTLLLVPLALFALLVAACTVDDSSLDTRVFECTADGQCGEGWGCVRAAPYAVDFCAPQCTTETCDGICTRDHLCLHGCQIHPDGTTSACASDDYACIRTTVGTNSGVCYPVTVCALDTDCAADQLCLSQGFMVPQLYCVPSAAAQPCVAGSVSAEDVLSGLPSYCLPTCGSGEACPPGFGCLGQLAHFSERMPPPPSLCVPGVPGISCVDDTNCLVGRCLNIDTSAVGKICTITCNEASREFGAMGCRGLSLGSGFESLFEMECDPAAGGGAEGGLCTLRYAVGTPGCTGPTEAYPCVTDPPGTTCLPLDAGGMHYDICTLSCTTNAQCNSGSRIRNFCAMGAAASGICYPRAERGQECTVDDGCAEGRCVGATSTTAGICT